MKVISGLENISQIPKETVSALGIFDGIHRGHQAIFKKILLRSKALRKKSLVITFSPHPAKIVRGRPVVPLLISLRHRLLLLERLGIDYCLVINFNQKFARMPALRFAREILVKSLGIREICVGRNFHFGRNKEGDIEFLKNLGKECGFKVLEAPWIRYKGRVISSSWIREEIRTGNLGLVEKLLGRPLSIYGRVIKGEGRGKGLGFPTANLNIEHEAIPPMGVYAVRILKEERLYYGLLNIGHRPTFLKKVGPRTPIAIEVYLFDFNGSLYGKFLEIEFVTRLRPEKKFIKIPHLISAMEKDNLQARQIFSQKSQKSQKFL
jgi:riboflavin kinase/FMN adenylyltransferase